MPTIVKKVIGNNRDFKNKINGLQHQWPACLHLLRVGQCLLAKHHKLILNVLDAAEYGIVCSTRNSDISWF